MNDKQINYMSLDVSIIYPSKKLDNYFLSHPYIYDNLSEVDKNNFWQEESWDANITHNLVPMASEVPITLKNGDTTTLYKVVWRPEEIEVNNTTIILPYLIQGLEYMISNRIELLPLNPSNGWGSYNGFMKFLLNYKQACEDNPDCKIETYR